jgi:Sulfatase-modifying factor enzyme 1
MPKCSRLQSAACYYTDSTQQTIYRTGKIDLSNTAVKWKAGGCRLPTSAEYEFAAKGGVKSKGYLYSGSDSVDSVAWTYLNAGNQLHPVGTKQQNELGLYDMSGNAKEWCWDWINFNFDVCKTVGELSVRIDIRQWRSAFFRCHIFAVLRTVFRISR